MSPALREIDERRGLRLMLALGEQSGEDSLIAGLAALYRAAEAINQDFFAALSKAFEMMERSDQIDKSNGAAAPKHMSQVAYISDNGTTCPVCRSGRIYGEGVEFENGATQDVYCAGCGAYWREQYVLIGYDHLVSE